MSEEIVEQPSEESTEQSLEDRIAEKMFGHSEQPEEVAEQEQPESEADDQPEEVEQSAEPEVVEVEFNGKQYKLPPELKDSLMAQSDYTRKTQELAEQRRLIEQQAQAQQLDNQFRQSTKDDFENLARLDWQLNQYKSLDWGSMDLEAMTRTRIQMDQLKDARDSVAKTIEAKRGQFVEQRQKLISDVNQKGHEYLKKHIPNWGSQEVAQEITKYGLSEGYSDVELGSLTDPRFVKTLWKARQWDNLQSQKSNASKKVEKAPPVLKPGATSKNNQSMNDLNYKKALRAAKTSSDKARIIEARIAQKWA